MTAIATAEFLNIPKFSLPYPQAFGGRGVWRLEDYFYFNSVLLQRTLALEPGFLTDFASVPRLPLAYALFGDTSHWEAVVHDWLYHHHEICGEAMANAVLLEAATVAGTPKKVRTGVYLGVKFGGKSSWELDGRGDGHAFINGVII